MTDQDTKIVDALAAIANAGTGEQARAIVTSLFPGSNLYAIDHSFSALVPLGDTNGAAIPLEGVLYEAMGGVETVEVEGSWWTPLPYGRFPLFVLRQDGHEDPMEPWLRPLFGGVVGRHLSVTESLEAPRRRTQMSVEAHLQWSQVHSRAERIGGYEVAGTLEPAYQVAGDIFDFAINPSGRLTIYSLDAMGHGQTATLSAVLALAAIRNARLMGADLVEQMSAADDALFREWGGDRFTTVVGVEVADEGIMVVNAGHEPLRMVTADGATSLGLQADPPAGVRNSNEYRLQELPPLQIGETLVMLSDGASDARNSENLAFGPDRIVSSLQSFRDLRPLPLVHQFVRELLAHSPDHADDITAVAVRKSPIDG